MMTLGAILIGFLLGRLVARYDHLTLAEAWTALRHDWRRGA